MEEFKRELKKRCDVEFSKLKATHRPKPAKKGTLKSVQNSLEAMEKLVSATGDMVAKEGTKLYPEMGLTKEQATSACESLIKSYLGDIKKNSGF